MADQTPTPQWTDRYHAIHEAAAAPAPPAPPERPQPDPDDIADLAADVLGAIAAWLQQYPENFKPGAVAYDAECPWEHDEVGWDDLATYIARHINDRFPSGAATPEPPAAPERAQPDGELESLRGWNDSAIRMLNAWDKVFDALGRPGRLGESKAVASLAEVERLVAAAAAPPEPPHHPAGRAWRCAWVLSDRPCTPDAPCGEFCDYGPRPAPPELVRPDPEREWSIGDRVQDGEWDVVGTVTGFAGTGYIVQWDPSWCKPETLVAPVDDVPLPAAALPVRDRAPDVRVTEALHLLYRVRDFWEGVRVPDRDGDTREGLLAEIHALIDPDPDQAWMDAADPGAGEPT